MSNNPDELDILKIFGRVRRKLNLSLTQALKPLGIGPKQALLLRTLKPMKVASATELSQLTDTDPAATGKIIDTLVKKNWVERVTCPGDRRRWQISLTAEGREATRKLDRIYRSLATELCTPLKSRDRESFFKMLTEISIHLETALKEAKEHS